MSTKLAIEVTDIKWDTDGEDIEGLPDRMSFEVEMPDDEPSETEINEAATEHMSSETSWCVESFTFASVTKVEAPGPSL